MPAYSNFFKLRYNLKNNSAYSEEIVKQWELQFQKTVKHLIDTNKELSCSAATNENHNFRISYGTSQSLDLEMVANANFDIVLISLTFVLIFGTAFVLMSINSTWVTSPGIMLPLSGILSALFGFLSSLGVLSMCGYPSCNLVFVTPFLVFGIGIDDMFIIYSSFCRSFEKSKKRGKQIDVAELISDSLAKSGVSITITSLTDFVGFMVGMIADFKSVQIFCVHAGLAIIFCYLYQLTFFCGFLCVHAHRVKQQRNAFLFCLKQKDIKGCACDDAMIDNEVTSVEMEKLNSAADRVEASAVSDHSNTVGFRIFKFFLTKKLGKSLVVIIYFVYIGLSLWSATYIHEGLNLEDLVSKKSHYHAYIKDNTKMIDLKPIVMFVIYEPLNYDDISTRIKIRNLYENAQKLDVMSKSLSLSWIEQYGNEPIKYKRNPANLRENLKFFPPYVNDVVIEKVKSRNGTKAEYQIAASRFYLQYKALYFSSEDAKPMNLLRKLCDESGLPILAYSMPFKYYEQFEKTMPNIVQAFVISTEAMFIIALIFIPDLVSVICIILSMFSIMIGLIGAMNLMSLSLSTITMIIVIMGIGFCIDFSAHIVHAFIADSGKGDRNTRALNACMHVGIPIFSSAFSTFIGVSLLVFCESFIFIAFFKTISVLMVLGVVNSLFFLPVLLSFVGPNWPCHKEDKTDDNDEPNQNSGQRTKVLFIDKGISNS